MFFFLSVFNFRGICSAWMQWKSQWPMLSKVICTVPMLSVLCCRLSTSDVWTQWHICHYLELDTVSRGDV